MSDFLQTPGGEVWRVRRRTLAWRPRRRLRLDLDPVGLALGLVGLPLLALEWVLALLATGVVTLARLARRGAWPVEAVLEGPTTRRLDWDVRGWRAAGRHADAIRAELSAGRDPSPHADRRAVTQGG